MHEAALKRGVKVAGRPCILWMRGPIQARSFCSRQVEVQSTDTPEVLQRRVMEQAEWKDTSEGDRSDCQWKGDGDGWHSQGHR